jgi:hypothetical protein
MVLKFNEIMKNYFLKLNIVSMKNWWTHSKIKEDKGGSFNVELYLRILEVKGANGIL